MVARLASRRKLLLPLLLAAACTYDSHGALSAISAEVPRGDFSDFVVLRDTFSLEESDGVITVSPAVTVDAGGLLVADGGEGQVRLYRSNGSLIHFFGGNGPGPKEFTNLARAVRLRSGQIAAADMGGKLSLFDARGEQLLATMQTDVVPLYDVAVLDADRVVLAGRHNGRMDSRLAHIYNLRDRKIESSFLDVPSHPEELDGAYAFTGFSNVAVRGDTIAAIFALTDSVYLFSDKGLPTETLHIPYRHFRSLTQPLPRTGTQFERQHWMETFSAASNLFWLRDGTFVVQYSDTRDNDMQWRLFRMTRSGDRVFDLLNTPMLLAASPVDTTLYFVRPGSETPNAWSAGFFRR